ncbi:unnamed protein product [Sphenostylis stenocarpa]|uniref:Uncharacterized protein n=1 Tax=Sphenostylis stenocarpa TaxID=92480 RepID=A0AA86VAY2_9FABA|nr:unnamed protein product [Sphenostylis stenocarpa]
MISTCSISGIGFVLPRLSYHIDIWEERKVLGSRGQGLKVEIMGKNHLLPAIKIAKRDAYSVRIKLAVGCLPEKILTAFQPVIDEHLNEEAALNNCTAAVHDVGKIVEDVQHTLAQGNQLGSTMVNDLLSDLQEQEKKLTQYMEQLENAEAARASLLSQLKHALQEQESRQELVHNQLLVRTCL